MKRVPPSARLKEEIEGLLRGDTTDAPPCDDAPMAGFVLQVARYILQVSIEAEATTFLGRGHYRRGDRVRSGWRNGYEPKRVQSEAGVLDLAVPQLRGTDERFQPTAVERLGTRTPDLEALVRGMYVRGLSTQDVSALYRETLGASRLSKSTVSRITQQLNQEFDTCRRRDLSDLLSFICFSTGSITRRARARTRRRGCCRRMRCSNTGGPSCCTSIWARGNRAMRGSVSYRI